MGFIYEDYGKIAIEGRRESFIVHARYGWQPGGGPVGQLRPGDEFRYPRENVWAITGVFVDKIQAERIGDDGQPVQLVLPSDTYVEIDGMEQHAPGPFAESWREGAPEFLVEDLDDLIEALTAYREAR